MYDGCSNVMHDGWGLYHYLIHVQYILDTIMTKGISTTSSPLLCGCYVIECIIFQIKPCNLCPVGIKYR